MGTDEPKISVVIVTFESYEIETVLDVLLAQLSEGDEVVLVDDHSSAKVYSIMERYVLEGSITFLTSANPGNRPANRNQGAALASNPVLLFLDGDIVLADDAISVIRQAHRTGDDVAFIGNVHTRRFDKPALELHLGSDEYSTLLRTAKGRTQLLSNPLIKDGRRADIASLRHTSFFWVLYYSAYCTVEKRIFDIIGGFEEACELWGGEDLDLAYQISAYGTIGFLDKAHGLHVPHPRNVFKNERTNADNYRMLFEKHRAWEFEVLSVYQASPPLLFAFDSIRTQMRLLDLTDIECLETDCLYIEPLSRSNSQGRITKIDESGNGESEDGMGLVIGAANNAYGRCYVSDNVFIYPSFITARILQEACRVGRETYIVPSGNSTRIAWEEMLDLASCKPQVRLDFVSTDVMDYHYDYTEHGVKVVKLY